MTPLRPKNRLFNKKKRRNERVENLPDDMNLDEFRNTGLDFGEAPHPKGKRVQRSHRSSHHSWDESGKRMVGFLSVKEYRGKCSSR